MRQLRYFIHINKIYVLVFCIYNNDYQSGVICTAMRDNDFFSWRRDMLHQFQSMAAAQEVYNLLQRETETLEYDFYTLCASPGAFHSPPRHVSVDLSPRMDVSLPGRELFRHRSRITPGEFYAWPSAVGRWVVSRCAGVMGRRARPWSAKG